MLPRSSQSLAAPFRGAKIFTQIPRRRLPPAGFAGRDLLPAPRKALQLRSGEQKSSHRSARRRLPPAGFVGRDLLPRSSQSLAAPFRGAKSSHRFRAAACPRPSLPHPGRDLLPAPRKALQLRSGEQNLHTDSAPPPAPGRFAGAICSPLLAKPCSSVLGSKIFTQIPRRRLPPAALPHKKKRRTLFCSWLLMV